MEALIRQIGQGLRATSTAEWVAVAMGLVYIVLIIRRHRLGWVAGGISSAILAVLFARAQLPMQALLQVSYVIAAVYGWWKWSPQSQPARIGTWHWRGHVLVLLACVLVSLALAALLRREAYSAYPFIDSLAACGGLAATWLVARVYLENWLYWIAIDAVSMWLCLTQGLVSTALLFALYLGIATHGYFSWRRLRRQQGGMA